MSNLDKRIDALNREIDNHEDANDGSLAWVDEHRDLIMHLDELERQRASENA